jgi:hypothetical protein
MLQSYNLVFSGKVRMLLSFLVLVCSGCSDPNLNVNGTDRATKPSLSQSAQERLADGNSVDLSQINPAGLPSNLIGPAQVPEISALASVTSGESVLFGSTVTQPQIASITGAGSASSTNPPSSTLALLSGATQSTPNSQLESTPIVAINNVNTAQATIVDKVGTEVFAPVAKSGLAALQAKNFELLGRFKVPSGGAGQASTGWTRGGMTLGSEGEKATLFIAGKFGGIEAYGGNPNVHIGEIAVPSVLSKSNNIDDLPVAQFNQQMTDALEGKISQVFDPSVPLDQRFEVEVRGLLKVGNKLLINAVVAWDGKEFLKAGHFSRPADLSIKNQIDGPVRVSNDVPARHTPGPMFLVPEKLRTQNGWPMVATGVNGISIAGTANNGPGIVLFNPDQISKAIPRSVIPGKVLSNYPYPNKTFAEAMGFEFGMDSGKAEFTNPWWTPANHTRGGGAWIEKFSTVAYFGLRGLGSPYYGFGDKPEAWGVVDPTNSDKAPHAYPYQHVIYLFNQDDYVKVSRGEIAAHQVKSTGTIVLPDPFMTASQYNFFCGSAFDSSNDRLYLLKCRLFGSGQPIVEVYKIRTD